MESDWVSIPVFTGPITHFERQGATITLEAQGKETLALSPHYATKAFSLRRGIRLEVAIKQAFRRIGEVHFTIPPFLNALGNHQRLSRNISVHPTVELWKLLVGGATDANGRKIPSLLSHSLEHRYAFYDGLGRLTVRRREKPPVYIFELGEQGTLIAHPTVDFDVLEFRNTVRVTGAKPKGKRHHITAIALLPLTNPLSPRALARNGKLRYMTEFVDAPGLKTHRACLRRARTILKRKSVIGLTASFQTLPIPMLEEHDRVILKTPDYHFEFEVTSFELPLTSDGTMTVGFGKSVRPKRQKIRRRT